MSNFAWQQRKPNTKTDHDDRWLTVFPTEEIERLLGGACRGQELLILRPDTRVRFPYSEESSCVFFCITGAVLMRKTLGYPPTSALLSDDPDSSHYMLTSIPTCNGFELGSENGAGAKVMLWTTEPLRPLGDPFSTGRYILPREEIERGLGGRIVWEYLNNLRPLAEAGHHFHKQRREIFRCMDGRTVVRLENFAKRDFRSRALNGPEAHDWNYAVVPPNVAHAVANVGEGIARFWVWTTSEPRGPDDFPHEVLSRHARVH